jgi:hypothetical protein
LSPLFFSPLQSIPTYSSIKTKTLTACCSYGCFAASLPVLSTNFNLLLIAFNRHAHTHMRTHISHFTFQKVSWLRKLTNEHANRLLTFWHRTSELNSYIQGHYFMWQIPLVISCHLVNIPHSADFPPRTAKEWRDETILVTLNKNPVFFKKKNTASLPTKNSPKFDPKLWLPANNNAALLYVEWLLSESHYFP